MAGMARDHFSKLHVFPRSRRCNGMTHHPDDEANHPKSETQPQRRRQRTIEDSNATRSSAEKYGFGQSEPPRVYRRPLT